MGEAKPFCISKQEVWEAYKRVKANQGAAGVDERWLKAPVQEEDGQLVPREKGTPQGGVISPLLANLFLHYAFDRWMAKEYPQMAFERYADDAIVHCRTEAEAQGIRAAIAARLKECGLELHPEKTKVVYCKDDDRRRT
jgi:RNA-directed DNA polymerase